MELTSECPYQCIFCYNVWKCSDNNSSKGMTRNQAFFVAEELIRCRVFSVILSGGEPTLKTYLAELVKYLRENGIDVIIITNGALLTEKLLHSLLKAGLQSMQISMHHFLPEKMNQITENPNSFKLTLQGIKNALKICGPEMFNVNMVATKDTVRDIWGMGEFLNRLGVNNFSIGMVSTCGQAGKNGLVCDNRDLEIAYNQLRGLHLKYGMDVAFTGGLPFCALPSIDEDFVRMANVCDAAMSQVVIGPEGNIRPCVGLPDVAGNIFTDDIIQVWRNSDVLNNIRQFRNTPITCRSCEDVDTCHGGCRASAQTYSGDTLGYDPMMPERRK